MNEIDFLYIQSFVLDRTGIVLTPEKRYLAETRLEPVVRQLQLPSLTALVAKLRLREPMIEQLVIDAMTTNETLFFRDKQPFDILREILLPKLAQERRGRGKLRIWCAACSSGQEPYSIAMIVEDIRAQLGGVSLEIVATDISSKVLDQARAGVFSQFEVQRGLPIKQLLKHFTQEGARWKIEPAMGRNITFQKGNLLQPFRHLGTFDLILCRNVMIYFNEATKRDVLKRLSEQLAPDGYLMLGGAETVLGLSEDLAPHQSERSVYVHRASPEAYKTGMTRLRAAG
ncbi:MAG: CheR family methyltransferase [Beijerinckiaceae bacterium]